MGRSEAVPVQGLNFLKFLVDVRGSNTVVFRDDQLHLSRPGRVKPLLGKEHRPA
jgi:hypothetical protein